MLNGTHRTTGRLLVGASLAGAVVLGAGAPALAATHTGSHHAHGTTHRAVSTPAPASVEIGTAVQYVRNADGTITQVTPR